MEKPYKGRVYAWKIRTGYQGQKFIVGRPVGHPEFEDWLITSEIMQMKPIQAHANVCSTIAYECVTRNSRYYLMGPEQERELPCPRKNYEKHGISF